MVDSASQDRARLDVALAPIYRLNGVLGVCLQDGGHLLSNHLPFSDKRSEELAARIDRFCSGYDEVGRDIRQFCIGFGESWLLVLCQDRVRLSFLVKPESELSLISGSGRKFLMDHPELVSPGAGAAHTPGTNGHSNEKQMPTGDLRRVLIGLMSKVIGGAQAQRIVDKEFSQSGLREQEQVSEKEAQRTGIFILEKIPSRARREALIGEFESLFKG